MSDEQSAQVARAAASLTAEAIAWMEAMAVVKGINERLMAASFKLADVRLDLGSLSFVPGAAEVADSTRNAVRDALDELEAASKALVVIGELAVKRTQAVRDEAEAIA